MNFVKKRYTFIALKLHAPQYKSIIEMAMIDLVVKRRKYLQNFMWKQIDLDFVGKLRWNNITFVRSGMAFLVGIVLVILGWNSLIQFSCRWILSSGLKSDSTIQLKRLHCCISRSCAHIRSTVTATTTTTMTIRSGYTCKGNASTRKWTWSEIIFISPKHLKRRPNECRFDWYGHF